MIILVGDFFFILSVLYCCMHQTTYVNSFSIIHNFKEAKKARPMHNDTLKELVLPRMH